MAYKSYFSQKTVTVMYKHNIKQLDAENVKMEKRNEDEYCRKYIKNNIVYIKSPFNYMITYYYY